MGAKVSANWLTLCGLWVINGRSDVALGVRNGGLPLLSVHIGPDEPPRDRDNALESVAETKAPTQAWNPWFRAFFILMTNG
jgi:hypothetical protein